MSDEKEELIIGIDLGTTFSMAAAVTGDSAEVLADDNCTTLTPSVVSIEKDRRLAGEEAISNRFSNPNFTFFSFKRYMGKSPDEVRDEANKIPYSFSDKSENGIRFVTPTGDISPEELSAIILKEVKRKAELVTGQTVKKAVITVPAYFDDTQRQATMSAAHLAGIEPVRIINEPTAASLAYGLDEKTQGNIVVYDLGGGTFDISVLKLKNKLFKVLATKGDTHLGGDDFDNLFPDWLRKKLEEEKGIRLGNDPETIQELKSFSEKFKILLSTENPAKAVFESRQLGISEEVTCTLEEFEEMAQPLVEKTLGYLSEALQDAKLKAADIEDVVMVGGSTRIPLVRRMVEEYFGFPPHIRINPDKVVAIGASVQGHMLMGKRKDFLLMDVIPLSLGIETVGGTFSKLIMKNSSIPAEKTEIYSTSVDNQTAIAVNIYQGEREMVADCRHLGKIRLSGIPPMPAGLPRVEVTFFVDNSGVLKVSAIEKRSGVESRIEIVPQHSLSKAEVRRIMEDSFDHAFTDFEKRNLADYKVKAGMVLRSFDKVSDKAKAMMDEEKWNILISQRDVIAKYEDFQNSDQLKKELDRFGELTNDLSDQIISSEILNTLTEN